MGSFYACPRTEVLVMSNKLIINAMLPETRIALLHDGEVQDLLIERDSDVGIVGNIYKGKVLRVLPGMQAAFVDIGHEKAAFLYVDDVYYPDMDKPMKTNPLPDKQTVEKALEASTESTSDMSENVAPAQSRQERPHTSSGGFRNHRNNRFNNQRSNRRNGGGLKNNRNNKKMSRGPRPNRFQNNRNLMNQRPRFMQPLIPGTPEEFAAQQNQYAKGMLDISEEEYLAEMEAKRKQMEAMKAAQQGQPQATNISDEIDDSIGNRVDTSTVQSTVASPSTNLEEFTEENTDESVGEIAEENAEEFSDEVLSADDIDSTEVSENDEDSESIEAENQTNLIEEEKPRQESYASAAAPDENLEPIARGFVPDDDSDEDSNDAAGITRSEPMIDIDAWVSEVQDTVQKVEAVDSVTTETVTAEAETVDVTATSVEPVDVTTAPAEIAAPVRQNRGRAPHHSNRKDRNFKGRNNRQPRSEEDDEMMPRRRREQSKIEDLVKEGMEIIVQVAKDPIATKGARLTCHVSLPGRYLVFMPSVDHVGVSRRIESDFERRRLKEIIGSIRPEKTGVIVRTASGKQTDEKLKEDLDFIVQTWNEIQRKFKKQKAPSVVYQDLNIVLRSIRDIVNDDIDEIIVDSQREFKNIQRFISKFIPHMKDKLSQYSGGMPIFDYYGIEPEIERALEKRVWLKSGGYIVIDQAEALVAIDVNTGRFVGKKNLEETILKTNLEAVKEIAYQMRVRNCGGIIIMDLIDMEKDIHKDKVFKALEEELKKDRARPTIMRISQLGLVEMTRKRTRDTIVRSLCQPCTHCKGRGFVKNPLTISYDILRDIERESFDKDTTAITIQCHPEVGDILQGDKGDVVERFEHEFGKKISIRSNGAYPLEHYEMVSHRGDGKQEAMNNEERRQKLRQKLNVHLQKLAYDERKQAQDAARSQENSSNQNDPESESLDDNSNSIATQGGALEGNDQAQESRERRPYRNQHQKRTGRFQKNNRNQQGGRGSNQRPYRNQSRRDQDTAFEQQHTDQPVTNENAEGLVTQANIPSVETENLGNQMPANQSFENQHADSLDQAPTQTSISEDIGNQTPGEQQEPQGNPRPQRPYNDRGGRGGSRGGGRGRFNNRAGGGGRTGGGRFNNRGRTGSGGGERRSFGNAGSSGEETPRKTRWDYIKKKYLKDDKDKKPSDSSSDPNSGNQSE